MRALGLGAVKMQKCLGREDTQETWIYTLKALTPKSAGRCKDVKLIGTVGFVNVPGERSPTLHFLAHNQSEPGR
jgi:hypothetical protein